MIAAIFSLFVIILSLFLSSNVEGFKGIQSVTNSLGVNKYKKQFNHLLQLRNDDGDEANSDDAEFDAFFDSRFKKKKQLSNVGDNYRMDSDSDNDNDNDNEHDHDILTDNIEMDEKDEIDGYEENEEVEKSEENVEDTNTIDESFYINLLKNNTASQSLEL